MYSILEMKGRPAIPAILPHKKEEGKNRPWVMAMLSSAYGASSSNGW